MISYDEWAAKVKDFPISGIEGAIRSGKSVRAVRSFAESIMRCPVKKDALFLACAVSESMAQALIGECAGFGLRFFFGRNCIYRKYKDKNALYIHYSIDGVPYTAWVLFVGGAKAGCENAIRGLSIQGAEIEELNLLTREFFEEVLNRQAVAEKPCTIFTMNPSMSKHWVYEDLIDSKFRGVESGKLNYKHATLLDNPAMTIERIKEISDLYDKDSVWYKGYILGERMNPAGAIYSVKEQNIIDSFKPEDYKSYVVVCDQGETISATAMTLGAVSYDAEKGFYHYDVIKEYHHVNSSGEGGEKHFEDYANDLADFVKESEKMMSYPPSEVIIDQDPEFYHQCLIAFGKKGLDQYSLKFPYKLEIEERVKRGVGMMHKGQLRFYKGCENTIEDFKNAEYDQKEIERKGRFVRAKNYTEGLGHLDMVDSVEYGFTRYMNFLWGD